VTGPLAHPPALPRGTVPGLSTPSPGGNLARLFPVVTPAPAIPGGGLARHGPSGTGTGIATALTADTGVIGTGQGRLIVLAVTVAAGIAAAGAWLTAAGPARKAVSSLAQRSLAYRRGRHTR
jgi:hypothetical protein